MAAGATPLAVAPAAHADFDFDDLFQPFVTAFDSAVGVVDPTFGADAAGSALATSFTDPLAPLESLLFGSDPGAAAAVDPGAATAAGADVPTNFAVPLAVGAGTEPTVNVSIGGGPSTSVLVDTGSDGLIIPWQDVNWANAGLPTGINVGAFSGGLDYVYLTLPTTVSFTGADGTITTGQTPVDVELFAFPTTLQGLLSGEFTLNSFLGGSADGILGIGPNAVGPSTTNPITALPGDLNQGVLIDQPDKQLVFGPDPLSGGVSVPGSPNATLQVSLNGTPAQSVPSLIDSGGVYGNMPDSLFGGSSADGLGLKAGTVVDVSTADGQLLYSYTVNPDMTNSPTITSGTTMNTGNIPFAQMPVYISNSPAGQGTTVFHNTP